MQLLWAPSIWSRRFLSGWVWRVPALVSLSPPGGHKAALPLSAGGAARAQVLLFSLLCGGCRLQGLGWFCAVVCLHSGGAPVCGRPPGDRPIHVPRPEAVSPLLGVSGVSSVLPFYLTEYLITTLNVLFSLFTFPQILQNQWTASRETNKCPSTFLMCGVFFYVVFLTKLEPKSISSKLLY